MSTRHRNRAKDAKLKIPHKFGFREIKAGTTREFATNSEARSGQAFRFEPA
jgi:hypothetical protein